MCGMCSAIPLLKVRIPSPLWAGTARGVTLTVDALEVVAIIDPQDPENAQATFSAEGTFAVPDGGATLALLSLSVLGLLRLKQRQ